MCSNSDVQVEFVKCKCILFALMVTKFITTYMPMQNLTKCGLTHAGLCSLQQGHLSNPDLVIERVEFIFIILTMHKIMIIYFIPRAGPEARPAAAIVNSPVCARARKLCDGL